MASKENARLLLVGVLGRLRASKMVKTYVFDLTIDFSEAETASETRLNAYHADSLFRSLIMEAGFSVDDAIMAYMAAMIMIGQEV